MPSGPDRLSNAGKPLFFKLDDGAASALGAPAVRDGRDEAVRAAVRSLSVMQKEAVVVSARSGAAWRLASDEGAYLDGHDVAPCPLSFFSTGMVCLFMEEILALANRRGIRLSNLKLVQDNFYTMRGSALKGTMTGGAKDVALAVSADTDAAPDTLRALVCDAVAAAPVNGLLRGVLPSLFTLTHNNAAITPEKARTPDRAALPDPDAAFAELTPAPGDWADLIVKGGMSPKNENTATYAGGSLAEEQDRLLHLRVTCVRRPDGVKAVEQQLFNPHGSVFRYLCDEAPGMGGGGRAPGMGGGGRAPGMGGGGRAPDAASYLAAGIAFCFMTQLGRYAKIAKKDLREYRIVQDLHLSAGGATGGTGAAGAADPVETHVHLASGENDGFARLCLDMSEQTCFLHALCRTDLKVRVSANQRAAEPV